MFTLDYGMLNISLPTISSFFNVSLNTVAKLPLIYFLIVTSSLLGFGKLGDIKGHKKIFILGVCIFVIGAFLCAFSRSMNMLLACRIFQCTGEAMFSPMGVAIITVFLPNEIKGRALGFVATAQGLGFALGPVLGGFIGSVFIWQGIFFVNIPIAIATIFFAMKILPEKHLKPADTRFDGWGAALIFMALATLIYVLNEIVKMGWKNPIIISCFVISVFSFTLFIFREKKIPHPLLDLKLFKNRNFSFTTISIFFALCVYIGISFLFPFYMERVRGLRVFQSGLILMIAPATMMILSPISGRFSDLIGSRFLCSLGMVFAALAFTTYFFLTQSSPLLFIVFSMLLAGTAMGLFMAPSNRLIMTEAPPEKQGMASGIYKVVINTGGIFGIVLFPLVLFNTIYLKIGRENLGLSEIRNSPDIMMIGFRGAFLFGIFFCLIAFLFSFLAKGMKKS